MELELADLRERVRQLQAEAAWSTHERLEAVREREAALRSSKEAARKMSLLRVVLEDYFRKWRLPIPKGP